MLKQIVGPPSTARRVGVYLASDSVRMPSANCAADLGG
jgi:hypothetical protein